MSKISAFNSSVMFTKSDYAKGLCSMQDFCLQFVDDTVIEVVRVGIGEKRIKASRDPNFNDIDIRQWDMISPALQKHLKEKIKAAGGVMSISLLICIEKEAARKIKQGR